MQESVPHSVALFVTSTLKFVEACRREAEVS